jgi:hypothetical protein
VFDYDVVSDNDFIGKIEMSLESMGLPARSDPVDEWWNVQYERKVRLCGSVATSQGFLNFTLSSQGRMEIGGKIHVKYRFRPRAGTFVLSHRFLLVIVNVDMRPTQIWSASSGPA